jgi:hypothetical protein
MGAAKPPFCAIYENLLIIFSKLIEYGRFKD